MGKIGVVGMNPKVWPQKLSESERSGKIREIANRIHMNLST